MALKSLLNFASYYEKNKPKETAIAYLIITCFLASILALSMKIYLVTYSFQRLLITRMEFAMILNTLIITKQHLKVYYYETPRIQKGLY